jgi:hypothetical protein
VKISLMDQIEELEQEWERRQREYPTLVAQGRMRRYRMDAKIARLQAAINTLEWLDEHADVIREYVTYATRINPPSQGGEWNPQVNDDGQKEAAE